MFGTVTNPNFAATPRPAFGRAAPNLPPLPTVAKIKADAIYAKQAKTAAEVLPELPAVGESLHVMLTNGECDLCSVIVATIARVKCRHLRLSTLAMSKRNAAELLGMLETQPEFRFTLILSEYFRSHNREAFTEFQEQLQEYPNTKIGAARVHCKLVLMDLLPEVPAVWESSANLRRNGCSEFIAVQRSAELHDFYAGFIDRWADSNDTQSRE